MARKAVLLVAVACPAAGVAPAADIAAKTAGTPGVALANADDPVRGPVLGYVHDASVRGLRPIFGIPGASYLGGALNLGVLFDLAEVSPRQDFALARNAASREIHWIDLLRDAPALYPVEGAIAGADRILFSPTGASALLFDRDGPRAQILTNLPDAPEVRETVRLDSIGGVLTALAVNDDGSLLLAAASQGEGGSLYALTAAGETRLLSPVGRVSSIQFLPGTSDALIADIDRNELLRISDAGGAAQILTLAGEQDGLRLPTAVASTSDGRNAIVVSAGERSLITVPAAGGPATVLACECEPRVLRRLRGNSVFQLTEALDRPLYLFEAELRTAAQPPDQPDQRIVFVPPAETGASEAPAPARVPRSRGRR